MTQGETELYETFISKQRKQSAFDDFSVKNVRVNSQAPKVQMWDSAIHQINHYPADEHSENQLLYPLDRDLSSALL